MEELCSKTKYSKLLIPATSGKVTIAKSWNLFSGNLDKKERPDWGTTCRGEATNECSVSMIECANSPHLARELGDPTQYELTPHQIVAFCESHRDHLRQDGFGTYFIMQDKGSWRVVRVRIMFGLMYVLVYYLYNPMQNPFSEATDTIWLVSPE